MSTTAMELSETEFVEKALELFSRDRSTATTLVLQGLDDPNEKWPITDNVGDLEERRALLQDFMDLLEGSGRQASTITVSLFLLAPVSQLRTQIDYLKAAYYPPGFILDMFRTMASIIVRSFLAKNNTASTPKWPFANSPKSTPNRGRGTGSSPLVSSPLASMAGTATVSPTVATAASSKRKPTSPIPGSPSAKRPFEAPAPTTPPAQKSPGAGRNKTATAATYKRDKHVCILSGYGYPDGAHIFPFSAGKDQVMADRTLDFLGMFWGSEAADKWRAECQDSGISESPKNIVCLAKHLHALWGAARFGLKPLRDPRAAAQNQVWVQFHWLNQGLRRPNEPVFADNTDVNQLVNEMAGLEDGNHGFAHANSDSGSTHRGRNGTLAHRTSGLVIETGQIFVIKADDPNDLPSLDLLELQWHLVRLAAMSGAANKYPEAVSEDDDDCAAGYAAVADTATADEDEDVTRFSLDDDCADDVDSDDNYDSDCNRSCKNTS